MSTPGPRDSRAGVEKDLRTIISIQALRAFLYGFGSVLLGVMMAAQGLSPTQVGAVFTAMLAGMAVSSIGVALSGDRLGRRRLYLVSLVVMGSAGAVFALTSWFPALIIAALTGTLSTDPNESGPITSLEQAMIGGAPRSLRTRIFGRYNAVAFLAGAVGSLTAGGPAIFRRLMPGLPPDQRFLLAFPLMAVLCLLLARRLSPEVEVPGSRASPLRRPLGRSRSRVARLSALFALDSGAGGLVVQSFIVFWFRRKFGTSTEAMGAIFFLVGILQAASSVTAARLGARIGLLNTMVFTHVPSNLLLAAIAFAPNFQVATALLLARFALSQMDVPTRQAYIAAMVDPEERTAAAAFTNTARYAARPVGPAAAGALMQQGALGAPFLVAGLLKVVYDGVLFVLFRKVPLPEEPQRPFEASPDPSG